MLTFVGTDPYTGQQFLIQIYDDGEATVATRPEANTSLRWSPPVPLVMEASL